VFFTLVICEEWLFSKLALLGSLRLVACSLPLGMTLPFKRIFHCPPQAESARAGRSKEKYLAGRKHFTWAQIFRLRLKMTRRGRVKIAERRRARWPQRNWQGTFVGEGRCFFLQPFGRHHREFFSRHLWAMMAYHQGSFPGHLTSICDRFSIFLDRNTNTSGRDGKGTQVFRLPETTGGVIHDRPQSTKTGRPTVGEGNCISPKRDA
jgi:hypothetical protein